MLGKNHYKVIHILVLLIFLQPGCGSNRDSDSAAQKEAVPVTVAEVTSMDVSHFLRQTGSLVAFERVLVKSEAKGKIDTICFEEGTAVNSGDLLVTIDDAKIRAEIKRLTAQIQQHTVQLAHTVKTLRRKKNLLKDEVISDQEYDDLVARKGVEEALIDQARAALALAMENLDDMHIRAPFDAMASERLVAAGDYVKEGDPVVSVVQVNPLKIAMRVFEKFKEKITPGMPVTVTVDAFPGTAFTGSVYFISPDVDVSTRTFLVKARLPNADLRLNPGMFANVSLEYERHKDAPIVPWDAVVQLEERAFVFVINNNIARQVPVTLLKVFDDRAEVSGAVRPGQKVVLEGKFTVDDGDRVAVQTARIEKTLQTENSK